MADTSVPPAQDPMSPSATTGSPLAVNGEATHPTFFRERSASPEPMGEPSCIEAPNSGTQQDSRTNSGLSGGSSDDAALRGLKKKTSTGDSRLKWGPQVFNKGKQAEHRHGGQLPERESTTNTQKSESFAETAVWDQKAILALDGGGIRGYSALLIIQRLMLEIGKIEKSHPDGQAESSYYPSKPPERISTNEWAVGVSRAPRRTITETSEWLPCHYFDYMAGTSTGGLIAIMLGRLRMNIDDCIREYETLGATVFGHSRYCHLRSPLFIPRDKYSEKILEQTIIDVVNKYASSASKFPGGRNFAFDENRCRVMVISYQKQEKGVSEKPYLFRTYGHLHKSEDLEVSTYDRNLQQAHDVPIWQVARATSAAPTYFKPVEIDNIEYLDGGFGANNPCLEMYYEVRKMNNNAQKSAKFILSVGTGRNKSDSRFKGGGLSRYWNYIIFARKWASESESTHEEMTKKRDDLQESDRFDYYRLNVESGLNLMKLDEWRSRGWIRIKTGLVIGRMRAGRGKPAKKTRGIFEKSEMDENKESTTSNGRQAHSGAAPLTPNHTPSIPGLALETTQLETSDSSLEHIPEWFRPRNKTLENIRSKTDDYLQQPSVQTWIRECAKILVDCRRERARRNPQRWEKACFSTWYQCRVQGCPRGEKKYPSRDTIRNHFLDKHRDIYDQTPAKNEAMERKLDSCKILVR